MSENCSKKKVQPRKESDKSIQTKDGTQFTSIVKINFLKDFTHKNFLKPNIYIYFFTLNSNLNL